MAKDELVYKEYIKATDTEITIIKLWSGKFIATYGNKTARITNNNKATSYAFQDVYTNYDDALKNIYDAYHKGISN